MATPLTRRRKSFTALRRDAQLWRQLRARREARRQAGPPVLIVPEMTALELGALARHMGKPVNFTVLK